jgi:hypothetical protein
MRSTSKVENSEMVMMAAVADGVRPVGAERRAPGRRNETPAAVFGEALAALSGTNADPETGVAAQANDQPPSAQAAGSARMRSRTPDLPERDDGDEIASDPSAQSEAGRVMALLAQSVMPQKLASRALGATGTDVGPNEESSTAGRCGTFPAPTVVSDLVVADTAMNMTDGAMPDPPPAPVAKGQEASGTAPALPTVTARQAIAADIPDPNQTAAVETVETGKALSDAKTSRDSTLSVAPVATKDPQPPSGSSSDIEPLRAQASAHRTDVASVGQPHAAPVPPGPSPASASLAAQWGQAVEWTTPANLRVLPVVTAGGAFGANEAVKVVRLQLQPAGLGKVHATIRSVGSTLTVEIVAEDENAFRQLSGDAAALPAMLSTAASPVSDVSIRWQGDPQDPSRQRAFDNAPGERRPGPGHERNDDRRSGDDNANRRPGRNPGRDASGFYV